MMQPSFWNKTAGRELDSTPLTDHDQQYRLVACLNVWNDRMALEQSVRTWKDVVDHVIVVDGSYDTTGQSTLSTDGTREFLTAMFPSIEIIDLPGASQCAKRSAYLQRGQSNDVLFVIDADEWVENASALRVLPRHDIGWVRVRSPLYAKEYGQPRLFRWRNGLEYRGRHHWLYCDEHLFCTHQYGGTGFEHRTVDVVLSNKRSSFRSTERRAVKNVSLAVQSTVEFALHATPRSAMSDSAVCARECLHIVQHAFRDDGLAPSRLHTAINRTTPHSSIFFRVREGPFDAQTQYDADKHLRELIYAEKTADVIHVHAPASTRFPRRFNVPTVLHHHGSRFRNNAVVFNAEAKKRNALVLVSNLELLSWVDGPAHFLPNVVPVARYKELAALHRSAYASTFRVAHSPSVREKKGTEAFLDACTRLKRRGYPIEPVLIENQSHGVSLAMKSACHAAFDSFWLGIQCSGLEAAAMGMPVIAGDEIVSQRYREKFGHVPYTFADDGEQLEYELRRLMDSTDAYEYEASRVHQYVLDNHDESAVALTYLDLLDDTFEWRSRQVRQSQSSARSLAVR